MRIRSIALATSALVIATVLAGCASQGSTGDMPGMNHSTPSSGSSPAADAGHNSADVMFAQSMIPHHQQAVEMADMVLKKDGIDDRVRTLAENIKAAQGPEITTMTGWLKTTARSRLCCCGRASWRIISPAPSTRSSSCSAPTSNRRPRRR
jgi:uncharacterized protein (DUF305 family)